MSSSRNAWMHLIAAQDSADNARTPFLNWPTISEDKVLQLVGVNDATEFSYLDEHEMLQSTVMKLQHVSFLSSFSKEEMSTFCGMLSVNEELLVELAQQALAEQNLTAPSSAKLISLVSASLECDSADITAKLSDFACLVPFLKRMEILLSIGGDDRLTINFNKDKLNKYMSSTVPRMGMLNRGSCTCSTVSLSNYALADGVRRQFLRTVLEKALRRSDEENPVRSSLTSVFQIMQSQLLDRIRRVTGLTGTETGAEIVLFPSGSDAEYLPLVAALVRSHQLAYGDSEKVRVINYVCAAGEVGSGTAAAAGGKHFSPLSPRGDCKLAVDSRLEGIAPHWVSVVQIKPRVGSTGSIAHNDSDVVARVRKDLAANPTTVAVLHVVCGSKTGLVHPSFDTVDALQAEFGNRLIGVVDACQLRCELRHLSRYTAKGYMTLITGSKFFTAPPFAGAVIVPAIIAAEIESHLAKPHSNKAEMCVIPTGLKLYLTGFEVSPSMPRLRSFLSEGNDWLNFGLHLRWACGVSMMERYAALPTAAVAEFTRRWTERVRSLVSKQSPHLRLLPDPSDDTSTGAPEHRMHSQMVAGVSGIVSVVVSVVDTEALSASKTSAHFEGFAGFSMSGNAFKRPVMVADTAQAENPAIPMRALDLDQCKEFHRLVTLQDVSTQGHTLDPAVAVRCMLGQPVKLADNNFAVVRIALGADMVVQALESGVDASAALDALLQEDDAVVTKMSLLARNWHSIVPSSTAEPVNVGNEVLDKMKRIDEQLLLPHCPHIVPDAQVSAASTTTVATVSQMLQELYPGACPVPEVAIFYDMDAVDSAARALKHSFSAAFPAGFKFIHCFAIKAAPITYLLHHAVQLGLGMETASIMEVKQALRAGCAPHKIVFDSPCKTSAEIDFALRYGVQVNANSLAEVEKIDAALKDLQKQRFKSSSVLGLRVNPMVGAGMIDALSTATATSKFGVPCAYADQSTGEDRVDLREQVVSAYVKYPFLRGIMCHVGSQGMPVLSMVQGAQKILELADEIDARCAATGGKFSKRITHVDIGGGLSANYDNDEVTPTFQEYAQMLVDVCGETLRRSPQRVIITEFGKALITKCSAIVTRVEECIEHVALAGKNITALVHTGADLMLRTCYAPEKFPHRIVLLDQFKQVLSSDHHSGGASAATDRWSLQPAATREVACVTIAGPLCFSGDVLGRNLPLPTPVCGDVCLLLDTGANTLSLFSRHCSRLSPPVYAFRWVQLAVPAMGTSAGTVDSAEAGVAATPPVPGTHQQSFVVACVREKERESNLLEFWG